MPPGNLYARYSSDLAIDKLISEKRQFGIREWVSCCRLAPQAMISPDWLLGERRMTRLQVPASTRTDTRRKALLDADR